jgi:hypothetical protein
MLGSGYLPSEHLGTFAWQSHRAGYNRQQLYLRSEYIDALEHAELVGLQQNWEPVRKDTAVLLSMLGIAIPMANAIEVHLPYALLIDGTLMSWLAGRKVLLVGTFARRLANVWKTDEFRDAYASLGPVDKVNIVGAVSTPSRTEGGSCLAYTQVMQEIQAYTFDVALFGCGLLGKIAAWRVRLQGRTALDVGFVFNALLGDPERNNRPVLRDLTWPGRVWWEQAPIPEGDNSP